MCLLYYYYIFAAASTHMCLCVLFHMQISWMRDYYKTNNLKTTTAEIGNGGRTVTCFTVFCLACFSTETWKYSFFIDFVCTAHIVLGHRSVLLGQTAKLHQRHGILHASYVVGCGLVVNILKVKPCIL